MEFEDLSTLVCSVQMYGGMWIFRDGQNDSPYYLAAKEKISPLSEDFDLEYFMKIFENAKKSLSVKAFLATEQRIPGLGNGVLQDILFEAKIHPKSKIQALTDADVKKLFIALKKVLAEMTAKGGRDTEKDLFGQTGNYLTKMSNKTYRGACPGCGGEITKQAYLGGKRLLLQ